MVFENHRKEKERGGGELELTTCKNCKQGSNIVKQFLGNILTEAWRICANERLWSWNTAPVDEAAQMERAGGIQDLRLKVVSFGPGE